MKNFRKVLALVLVVATLFSFTAMTSAAYEDADKISYTQAVDVLSAVGVLNGYEVAEDEFEFHPTDTITREEMAKMIAVMCNAGDDISKLYASACTFADVAKDRWSASYVAYCAKTGIVAGRSASTFDPTGKVTGLETAKMLLVALGFNAEEQGYVGADWKVNVIRDVKSMSLLSGFAASYDIEAAITREEAAQMMLNALLNNVVIGYLSDASKIVVTNKAYTDWNGTAWTLIDAKGTAKLYGKVVISNTTLWEALYGGNLETVANARDCFGRPSAGWKWTNAKGKVTYSGTYPVAAKWTSNDTTWTAVEKEIKTYLDREPSNFYVDGEKVVSSVAKTQIGHGTRVEIYAYDVNTAAAGEEPVYKTQLDVVIINTYFGTIGHPQTSKGTVQIKNAAGDVIDTIKNTYGYTVADEGTPVMYWVCSEDITKNYVANVHGIEELTAKAVTLHGNRNFAGYFCDTDENEYKYNFTAPAAAKTTVAGNLAKKVYIYTDKNGFVLNVATVAAETTYSVLVGGSSREYDKAVDNYGKHYKSWGAKFVEFEADAAVSEETAVTQELFYRDILDDTNDTVKGYDRLVKWTTDAYGNRDLAENGISARATIEQGEALQLKKGQGTIVNFEDADGNKLAGNEATQYIIRLRNADTGSYVYKYFDGCDEIDANYVLNDMQYFVAYTNSADKTGRYLSYVYGDATEAKDPSLAFVLSYATDESYKEVGGDEVTYHLYNAIVNGEEAYVAYTYESIRNTAGALKQALINVMQGKTTAADLAVNVAVQADYVKVIVDTHEDKPIYIASTVYNVSAGTEFEVVEGVLTYKNLSGVIESADMAAGATIIVIEDYATGSTYTDGVVTLSSYDALINYLSAHGWTTQYAYIALAAGTDDVATLYIYVTEAA